MDGLLGEIDALQEMKQHHHELMAQEQNRCREGIAEERQYAQLQQGRKAGRAKVLKVTQILLSSFSALTLAYPALLFLILNDNEERPAPSPFQ